MPPVGFEPTISAGEWPQTYALDGAATGIGKFLILSINILCVHTHIEINVGEQSKLDFMPPYVTERRICSAFQFNIIPSILSPCLHNRIEPCVWLQPKRNMLAFIQYKMLYSK